MAHNKLFITTSRSDELLCANCGKPLGERTLGYRIHTDGVLCDTIPLCAECLYTGARMLDNANTLDSLENFIFPVTLEIQYNNNITDSRCTEEKTFQTKEAVFQYIKDIGEHGSLEKIAILCAQPKQKDADPVLIAKDFIGDTPEYLIKTGSFAAEHKYIEWLLHERRAELASIKAVHIDNIPMDDAFIAGVYDLYLKGYRKYDFCEICVTKDTVVRLKDRSYKISDLTLVEYNDNQYALIEQPEQVTNDLYAAHAFRLGDNIASRHYVNTYNLAWEIEDEDDNPPYILEDPVYAQDLKEQFDIWKGDH